MKIGSYIALYMRVNDIKIYKMASMIGVSASTVRRVVANRKVEGDTLLKLIKYFFGG